MLGASDSLKRKSSELNDEDRRAPKLARLHDLRDDSPDEAVEALLELQHTPSPRFRKNVDCAHLQGSGPSRRKLSTSQERRKGVRPGSKKVLVRAQSDSKQSELPKRCSCGKHITKEHPLCKSNVKELLERFLDRYCRGAAKGSIIDLQQAEMEFDVALRRLYDILVVLEAAQVLLRVSSKKYEVLGLNDMPALLSWLDKYQEQRVQTVKKGVKDEKVAGREQGGSYDLSCMLMVHLRKQKKPVVLSDAAEVLKALSPKAKACKKTIERRIYDISSVLETLNLIKRSYQPPNKQPSFQWNEEFVVDYLHSQSPKAESSASNMTSIPSSGRNSSSGSPALVGTETISLDVQPSSAFTNWAPNHHAEATDSKEEMCPRYSSDQMSDWSNQTGFVRYPSRAWPNSATDFPGCPSINSAKLALAFPLTRAASLIHELPSFLSGFPGHQYMAMPESTAALSISPLNLRTLDMAPHVSGISGSLLSGSTLCKPQAVRAQSPLSLVDHKDR